MGIHRPRDPERGKNTIEATGNQIPPQQLLYDQEHNQSAWQFWYC